MDKRRFLYPSEKRVKEGEKGEKGSYALGWELGELPPSLTISLTSALEYNRAPM